MSKPKRSNSTLPKSTGFGVLKANVGIKTDAIEQVIVKQENKLLQNIGFAETMQGIQFSIASELINEASSKFVSYTSEIQELVLPNPEIGFKSSSYQIIESIEKVIALKSKVMGILSWGATIANIANHVVITFDVRLPDELLHTISQTLEQLIEMFDAALSNIPSISILGITLSPDQKQISETKSLISGTLAKIDKIKQEIAEGYEDWGAAEQSASERIMDDNTDFVSGEEILGWIERLEAGEDV
jgi:hypothetical protein